MNNLLAPKSLLHFTDIITDLPPFILQSCKVMSGAVIQNSKYTIDVRAVTQLHRPINADKVTTIEELSKQILHVGPRVVVLATHRTASQLEPMRQIANQLIHSVDDIQQSLQNRRAYVTGEVTSLDDLRTTLVKQEEQNPYVHKFGGNLQRYNALIETVLATLPTPFPIPSEKSILVISDHDNTVRVLQLLSVSGNGAIKYKFIEGEFDYFAKLVQLT